MDLHGTYTALISPMKKNGEIDMFSLEKLINIQLSSNVQGIVILGTTGENSTLDNYERHKIIKLSEKLILNKKQLIVGISANSSNKAIDEVKILSTYNIDAFLVSAPYYNKPTTKGIIEHFTKIANESYKPIILYNVPSRTSSWIPIEAINILSKHPNIIGIKEASGDFNYITKLMTYKSNKFRILSGNDNLTLPMMSLGCEGLISVASNLVPNEISNLVNYALSGEFKKALFYHELLMPIFNACFIETNPIPIKYLLSKFGIIKNYLRLPLTSISSKNKAILNKSLKIDNINHKK